MEPSQVNEAEKIVFPWMGIIVNIPRWKENDRYVGKSGSNIRDELIARGFNPVRVNTLWSRRARFSGYAVVEFKNDWFGLQNALAFEKMYEASQHGRKDYHASRNAGDGLFGWMAKEADYNSSERFAEFLSENGNLKTVDEVQADEKTKMSCLVSNLTQELDEKSQSIKNIECKVNETTNAVNKLIEQNGRKYEEERKKMQEADNSQLKAFFSDHEAALSRLEVERRKLMAEEEELRRREALNEQEMEMLAQQKEREQLARQKQMNEMATFEQKIMNEKLLKLAEEQKKEKEQLHARIIEMQKNLDEHIF